jgi:hypothetical protein
MLKYLIPVALLTAATTAGAVQCVLQNKTVNRSQAAVQERSQISTNIVPDNLDTKKCMVTMRVKIANNWHTAFGEQVQHPGMSLSDACTVAIRTAEQSAIERVSGSVALNQSTMICTDQPGIDSLVDPVPGTSGDISQFRPHPDYPREFWYNRTRCRWFLNTAWQSTELKTFQGVICQTTPRTWVVVDKF